MQDNSVAGLLSQILTAVQRVEEGQKQMVEGQTKMVEGHKRMVEALASLFETA